LLKKSQKSYDNKCYDLAKTFLDNAGWSSTRATEMLAQEIQNTVENFIDGYEPTEAEQNLVPIPDGYAEP